MDKKKWYESSTGNGDLALTIKGALLALVPAIILVGQIFNIGLTQEDLIRGVEIIAAMASSVIVVIGLSRKLYFWVRQTFKI